MFNQKKRPGNYHYIFDESWVEDSTRPIQMTVCFQETVSNDVHPSLSVLLLVRVGLFGKITGTLNPCSNHQMMCKCLTEPLLIFLLLLFLPFFFLLILPSFLRISAIFFPPSSSWVDRKIRRRVRTLWSAVLAVPITSTGNKIPTSKRAGEGGLGIAQACTI